MAVAMFGSAGLFAKLINQSAFVIVCGRVFFSFVVTFLYFKLKGISIRLNNKEDYKKIFFMSIVLALHWVLFYHSVQLTTVAIGLLTFSTCPIFATFLEPLFFKEEKLTLKNIAVAFIAFFGVTMAVPTQNIDITLIQGFAEGILSGLTFAFVSILERKNVKNNNVLIVSFYEQVIVFAILFPIFLLSDKNPFSVSDILYLMLFSIVFTLISRLLYMSGLKEVSAQTAGVLTTLEPIYGIVLAALVLNEIPSSRELLGGVIIIGAALYSSINNIKEAKKQNNTA